MTKPKAWMSWSSGKDSAWALHQARLQGEVEITGLLTTVTDPYDRVSMHGVRVDVLRAQADALGLPLHEVRIPDPCANETYNAAMAAALAQAQSEGVTHMVFGDLFLRDIREYRENRLRKTNMRAVFPLWGQDTRQLAKTMIVSGLRAVVTCVDSAKLPKSFAGKNFDEAFLMGLPEGTDPCAENGEFHSLVYDGPMFSYPIPLQPGEIVEKGQFIFADFKLAPFLDF